MKNLFKGKNTSIVIVMLITIIFILILVVLYFVKNTFTDNEIPAGKPLSKITELKCEQIYDNTFGKVVNLKENSASMIRDSRKTVETKGTYRLNNSDKWKDYKANVHIFFLKDNKISIKDNHPGATDSYNFEVKVNDRYKIMGITQEVKPLDNTTRISVPVLILDKQTGHMIISEAQSYKTDKYDGLLTNSHFYKCTE